MLVDRVAFGERVDAPPQLSKLPRGAKVKSEGKFNNLLLLKKLQLPEHKVKTTKEKTLEDERKRVIDAYRTLKNRQKL